MDRFGNYFLEISENVRGIFSSEKKSIRSRLIEFLSNLSYFEDNISHEINSALLEASKYNKNIIQVVVNFDKKYKVITSKTVNQALLNAVDNANNFKYILYSFPINNLTFRNVLINTVLNNNFKVLNILDNYIKHNKMQNIEIVFNYILKNILFKEIVKTENFAIFKQIFYIIKHNKINIDENILNEFLCSIFEYIEQSKNKSLLKELSRIKFKNNKDSMQTYANTLEEKSNIFNIISKIRQLT